MSSATAAPTDHSVDGTLSRGESATGSIFLAEDNLDDAFLFQKALHKLGFPGQIHHVEAGDSAIEWLGSLSPDQVPALLVLDLKMPRVGGFEVLEWIRSHPHLQKVPTFIFSSSGLHADYLKAQKLGATGYVQKPLTFQDYKNAIGTILSQHPG